MYPNNNHSFTEGILLKRLFSKVKLSDLQNPSVLILILANLVPVFGVLFLAWQVFPILVLYWMENVVVGFFNVLKMLTNKPTDSTGWRGTASEWASKMAIIPFFCVHYGIFTLVHGVFVFVMFGGFMEEAESATDFLEFFRNPEILQLMLGASVLFISHGVSFAVNYIGKGEYKEVTLNQLMGQPYVRVIILHMTIIFGGGLITLLGSPIFALLLLVGLKIGIDVLAHLKQHARTV
jgi:hypothetical protein